MKYTVLWQPKAEAQLAEIWQNAPDRAKVARAADEIDKLLAMSPDEVSESREGQNRVVFVEPLGADFRIYEADRLVRIGRIWRF